MLTHQWLQQAHQRLGEKWKEASFFQWKNMLINCVFLTGERCGKIISLDPKTWNPLSNHYTGGGTSIPCSVSKLVMMLEWWVIDFFRNQESGPCTNTRKSSQPNWERKKYWTSKIVFVCFFVYFFVFRGPWNSCCNLSSRQSTFPLQNYTSAWLELMILNRRSNFDERKRGMHQNVAALGCPRKLVKG